MFRLVEQLGPFSRYKLALADDDDAAQEYLDWVAEQERTGQPVPEPRPSLKDWTPEREQTVALVNQFLTLDHLYVSAHSKRKPQAPKFMRGPETARDRAERMRETQVINDIRSKMLRRRR